MKSTITFALLLVFAFALGQSDSSTVLLGEDTLVQQSTEVDSIKNTKLKNQSALDPPTLNKLISFSKIAWSIVFLLAAYLIIKILTRSLTILAERSTNYRITIKSFIPIIRIAGWISVIFIIIAGIFQPPATTLLAFSASIGVAVGFASQDILKNIFGGVMILFDRPFQAGDKIEVGSHYGEVVEIGLRSTRIQTPDDNLVSIPNSEIMNQSVSNANAGESNCQVSAEIFLPIDADTSKARSIGIEAAKTSNYVYLNKPIMVLFTNEYKDRESILKMIIKAYVLDIRDEFKFKSELTEITIGKLIEQNILPREKS